MRLNSKTIIIGLIAFLLQVANVEIANSATKSRDYRIGYNWVMETDVYTLLDNGINRAFNIQGNPVKSKAEAWCYNREYMIIYKNKRSGSDWTKGCTAAVMKLKLSQLLPSDY